ncbi:hypothetical protein IF2G_09475 [Cordyceps javanica]|nr:hypothetical protein IF2G_09475 [Cordyceps javanica]
MSSNRDNSRVAPGTVGLKSISRSLIRLHIGGTSETKVMKTMESVSLKYRYT